MDAPGMGKRGGRIYAPYYYYLLFYPNANLVLRYYRWTKNATTRLRRTIYAAHTAVALATRKQ